MPTFDDSLPMILYRALDAVMPAYRELFARHGLTEQQWRVLRVIWTSDNVTSSKLSERTLLSPPSLVNIIDRLENKGIVARIRSVEDRREVYVVATAKGRELQKVVTPQVAAIHECLRSSVSNEEWAQMQATLTKISATIGTSDKSAAAGL